MSAGRGKLSGKLALQSKIADKFVDMFGSQNKSTIEEVIEKNLRT